MTIAAGFTEKLKELLRVSEVVSEKVSLSKKGKDHFGCCPFHKEKTPSFSVNDNKQFYHCFGCGETGDIITFIEKTHNLQFAEAVRYLANKYNIPVPEVHYPQDREHDRLFKINELSAKWFYRNLLSAESVKHVLYLQERGISKSLIKEFFLGYAPSSKKALVSYLKSEGYGFQDLKTSGLFTILDDGTIIDKFRDRIVFPIANSRGKIIGFGGRSVANFKPKYLNSPETTLFHKREVLYNFNNITKAGKSISEVFVVEGYIDVISMSSAGIKNVVASLGTSISDLQLKQLWKVCETPVVCMDGDNAGFSAMIRCVKVALPLLRPGLSIDFVRLPKDVDPDDLVRSMSVENVQTLLNNRIPLSEVLWSMLLKDGDFSSPEKRALLKQKTFELLKEIEDRNVRDSYYQHFNKKIFDFFNPRKQAKRSYKANDSKLDLVKFSTLEKYAITLMAIILDSPSLMMNDKVHEEFFAIEVNSGYFNKIHKAIADTVSEIECSNEDDYSEKFASIIKDKLPLDIINFLIGKDSYFLDKISAKNLNNMITSWGKALASYNLEMLKLEYVQTIKTVNEDSVEAAKIIKSQILQQEYYIKENF